MRYAILSDIHSNLEALDAVRRDMQAFTRRAVSLGNVVGYGANPNECVQLVHDTFHAAVAGTHDQAACGLRTYQDFAPDAHTAMRWTTEQLGPSAKDYLLTLPLRLPFSDHASAFHGMPRTLREVIIDAEDAQMALDQAERLDPDTVYNFFGWTHVPTIWTEGHPSLPPRCREGRELDGAVWLDPLRRHLINPGSVGQPRNGRPEACYAVLDTAESTVQFRRVAYDVSATRNKIRAAGLPETLALRLTGSYRETNP